MKLTLEMAQEVMKRFGGALDLRGTEITSLPENLTVGGWLDLRGTEITSLPENLTVGGALDLRGMGIVNPKVKRLRNGDYVEGRYLYADGILTHIKKMKKFKGYTFFVGKIPGKNVMFDGTNYAHCKNWSDGKRDLLFKAAKDRGADQYNNLCLDSVLPHDEMVATYRIITGACQQGTEAFLGNLGNKRKGSYTIREAIELTRGQYGAEQFERFFTKARE